MNASLFPWSVNLLQFVIVVYNYVAFVFKYHYYPFKPLFAFYMLVVYKSLSKMSYLNRADPGFLSPLSDTLDPQQHPTRFCPYCNCNFPLRSKHVRSINKCVATFDHQCNLLNTCIGEKNRFTFIVFLVWELFYHFLSGLIVIFCNPNFEHLKVTDFWADKINSFMTVPISFFFFVILFVLFVFSLSTAFNGETQYENSKGQLLFYIKDFGDDCFDDGFYVNMANIIRVQKQEKFEIWNPRKGEHQGIKKKRSAFERICDNEYYSCC
ncbi:Palmitoyltransferase [Hexamita inflata]|uniref:Palmitoyltransferase n=1 Tax=Hexamita inflata TaxID=28002 RepID=A0AA86UNQ4_9EUKA|nr:Palmitoyltransferase [Hexamita inflata]